jgi:hypothetical protein
VLKIMAAGNKEILEKRAEIGYILSPGKSDEVK